MNILKSVKQRLKEIYYHGNRFCCPLCGRSARRFLDYDFTQDVENVVQQYQIVGMGSRRNGRCPWCWSKDRERLMWLFLRDYFLPQKDDVCMLHVALEARIKKKLRQYPNIEYVSGDKFAEGYAYDETTTFLDVTNLNFQDNSFDLIICNHVLEHVLDDHEAMGELFRVLRPGGKALLQIPISYSLEKTYEDHSIHTPQGRLQAFGQTDHVRIYGRDYTKRLTNAGFKVKEITQQELRIRSNQYAINPEERIYLCSK